jgi:hypothetical protein
VRLPRVIFTNYLASWTSSDAKDDETSDVSDNESEDQKDDSDEKSDDNAKTNGAAPVRKGKGSKRNVLQNPLYQKPRERASLESIIQVFFTCGTDMKYLSRNAANLNITVPSTVRTFAQVYRAGTNSVQFNPCTAEEKYHTGVLEVINQTDAHAGTYRMTAMSTWRHWMVSQYNYSKHVCVITQTPLTADVIQYVLTQFKAKVVVGLFEMCDASMRHTIVPTQFTKTNDLLWTHRTWYIVEMQLITDAQDRQWRYQPRPHVILPASWLDGSCDKHQSWPTEIAEFNTSSDIVAEIPACFKLVRLRRQVMPCDHEKPTSWTDFQQSRSRPRPS